MAELFEAVVSWPTLVMVLLVFGLFPGTVLRLFVRCYPKGDPRRLELVRDLYVMKYIERPLWVVTQIETAVHEGLALRWEARQARQEAKPYRVLRKFATIAMLMTSSLFAFTIALTLRGALPTVVGICVGGLAFVGILGAISVLRLLRHGTRAKENQPALTALVARLREISAEIDEIRKADVGADKATLDVNAKRLDELSAQVGVEQAQLRRIVGRWNIGRLVR